MKLFMWLIKQHAMKTRIEVSPHAFLMVLDKGTWLASCQG